MPTEARMDIRSPGPVIIDCYELSSVRWKMNFGPIEEKSLILTTEPSPQPFQVEVSEAELTGRK